MKALLDAAKTAERALEDCVTTLSAANLHADADKAKDALDALRVVIGAAGRAPVASQLFAEFWRVYPKRIDRSGCLRKWVANDLDKVGDRIIAHVKAKAATPDWKKDGMRYVPMPSTYLNQRRWEEQIGVAVGDWWGPAGFDNQFAAENAGCKPHTAHLFRNGEKA